MDTEDKVRSISELYKEKSQILEALSTLNDPTYIFTIGKEYKNSRYASGTIGYYNLETGFLENLKKMTIEQYLKSIERIDQELDIVLKS